MDSEMKFRTPFYNLYEGVEPPLGEPLFYSTESLDGIEFLTDFDSEPIVFY